MRDCEQRRLIYLCIMYFVVKGDIAYGPGEPCYTFCKFLKKYREAVT